MDEQTDGVVLALVLVISFFVLAKLAPLRYVATAPRVEAAIDLLASVRRRAMLSTGDGSEALL